MDASEVAEKEMFVWTEQMEREARDYCKWEIGDDFDEEIFQEAGALVAARNNEKLRRIDAFYDDEIARLEDKMYGLEPLEPEPTRN